MYKLDDIVQLVQLLKVDSPYDSRLGALSCQLKTGVNLVNCVDPFRTG